MASWRDSASQQAQDDLDELVGVALDVGQQQLATTGEFYPFAVALPWSGETELVGSALTVADDRPDVESVLASVWEAVGEMREGLRAGAVVTNRSGPDGDAIAVQLEHREGQAIEVALAYELHGNDFRGGRLTAGSGTPHIWG